MIVILHYSKKANKNIKKLYKKIKRFHRIVTWILNKVCYFISNEVNSFYPFIHEGLGHTLSSQTLFIY